MTESSTTYLAYLEQQTIIEELEKEIDRLRTITDAQGAALVRSETLRADLEENLQGEMAARWRRLDDALGAIDYLAWESARRNVSVHSHLLCRLLADAHIYAVDNKISAPLAYAIRDHDRFVANDTGEGAARESV